MGRPPEEAEVRALLAICKATDDQDTGSLDAFREAATVGVVAALCESWLAHSPNESEVRALLENVRLAALCKAAVRMRERIREEDRRADDFGRWNECVEFDDALAAAGATCLNCDHGTDPKTLTTCNECEGTGVRAVALSVYAVEWGNEFPAELDSLWLDRQDAEAACEKKNADSMSGAWRVTVWKVR